MPYVGRGLTTGAQYQKLDAIAINNATTFTMSVGSANVSPDQNHLILVVNGVIQEPGTGFTVSGSTCTLASAITTSGHSGTDTIYGVIAGDAAFAAYDSIGANALGVTAGTVTASRAIVPDSNKDIASFRNVTLTGELDAATLDISGNADIDGTTNLDAVDIDGAVQVDNTITVGADDQGYDVKFFGDTASAYMLWDTSADDLVLAGAAGIDLAGDLDVDGTANLDVVDIDGAVDMASTLTLAGNADFNGDLDVDGTTNLDAVDIDGAVQIDNTVTVGVDDTGHDVKFFGATATNGYMLWDESTDDLILGSSSKLGIGTTSPGSELEVSGSGSPSIRVTDTTNTVTGKFQADDTVGKVGTHTNHAFEIFTNNSTRVSVANNGPVTISENLIVGSARTLTVGSVSDEGDAIITNGADGGRYDVLTVQEDGNARWNLSFEGSSSTNSLTLNSNSTSNVMHWDNATGNIGIGDASPSHRLVVKGASGTSPMINVINSDTEDNDTGRESTIRFSGYRSGGESVDNAQITGAHDGSNDNDEGMLTFWTNPGDGIAQRMAIRGSGQVNISGSVAATQLYVEQDNTSYAALQVIGPAATSNSVGVVNFYVNNGSSSHAGFHLTQAGRVGIGLNDPDVPLVVKEEYASDPVAKFWNDGDNTNRYGIVIKCGEDTESGTNQHLIAQDGNGSVTGVLKSVGGTFQLADSSDIRLKENIKDTTIEGIETVNKIKVRDFDWKKNDNTVIGGFIANELQEVYPQAVDGEPDAVDNDGSIKAMTVSRDVLVPLLIKAVQELSAKVEALEAK